MLQGSEGADGEEDGGADSGRVVVAEVVLVPGEDALQMDAVVCIFPLAVVVGFDILVLVQVVEVLDDLRVERVRL